MSIFINDLKEARLLGHPIHSMLVHFPSALYPISLVFDLLALFLHDTTFAFAAFYTLAAGLLSGFGAAIFGAIDYYRMPSDHQGWHKASRHAFLNIVWFCLFTLVLGLRLKQYPHIQVATILEIVLSFIGVIGLIYSNYLGGDLIFRHHLGIHKDPIDG